MKTIAMIICDVQRTDFFRKADVFEDFKILVDLENIHIAEIPDNSHLEDLAKSTNEVLNPEWAVALLINVETKEYWVMDGVKVLSTGYYWSTVSDLVKSFKYKGKKDTDKNIPSRQQS